MGSGIPQRPPGRPRSALTRRAILDAALTLAAREPYEAVTVDRIAAVAQVGKQSIYRWWTSKADVILDAFAERETAKLLVPGQGGHVLADLEALLASLARIAAEPGNGRILKILIAEAQLEPSLHAKLDALLFAPRRAAILALLERGRARGEIAVSVELRTAADLLLGAVWFRVLADPAIGPPDLFAAEVMRVVGPGLAAGARVPPPRGGGLFEA